MKNANFYVIKDTLASKNMRFVNHLIDLIPQYAIMYAIAYSFFYYGEFTGDYALNNYWAEMSRVEDLLYSYFLMFLYYFSIEGFTNRSLGKYITKTMVVMENGEQPTLSSIFIRSLCRMIPFDALSFLGGGIGWHDSISKTYVVDIYKFERRKGLNSELDQIGVEQDI